RRRDEHITQKRITTKKTEMFGKSRLISYSLTHRRFPIGFRQQQQPQHTHNNVTFVSLSFSQRYPSLCVVCFRISDRSLLFYFFLALSSVGELVYWICPVQRGNSQAGI